METAVRILVGHVIEPYGLQGGLRLKFYADSLENLKTYTLFDALTEGRPFKIRKISPYKETVATLFLEGVTTRAQAEALKGVSFYIDRAELAPLPENEYYYDELEGLEARTEDNKILGHVKAVTHYGGGAMLNIVRSDSPSGAFLVPFRKEFVKEVHPKQGYLVLDAEYARALCALEEGS